MIVLDLDADELDALARSVGATESIAKQALRSALGKTARWANTRVRRAVAKATDVPQGVLNARHRFDLRLPKGDTVATIWVGLNAVSAIHVRARETRRGVRAGKHQFEGAFIGRGRAGKVDGAGHAHVWRRVGKERLPVAKQVIDIAEKGRAAIRGEVLSGIERQFRRTFMHELEWRMQRAA